MNYTIELSNSKLLKTKINVEELVSKFETIKLHFFNEKIREKVFSL